MKLLLALPKGRILPESLELLHACGLRFSDDISNSRKLIFAADTPGVEIALLRNQDVIAYVDSGSADLGIAGLDLLLEHEPENVYTMFDLALGRCQLVCARLAQAPESKRQLLRVATKYPKLAHRFYAAQGQQIQPIKLYGSMELAPKLDIADEIVDIVSTGNTLKANNMVISQHIMDISSHLIVNKNALKTKYAQLQALIETIRSHA